MTSWAPGADPCHCLPLLGRHWFRPGLPRRQVRGSARTQRGRATSVRLPPQRRGSQTHGLAYVEAHPRPQCRAHATRFGQRRGALASLAWIGCSQWHGSAAACSRLQHVPSAAGSLTGGTRLQHSACGCNTVHVVATQCASASHLFSAEGDVPEGSSGDTDVGLGMDSVSGQTSRCTSGCGVMDLFPVQMWARAWTQSR